MIIFRPLFPCAGFRSKSALLRFAFGAWLGATTAFSQASPNQAPVTPASLPPPVPVKVPEIYAALCASCHGAKSEGGLGGSLADGNWKHGDSDDSIATTITSGLSTQGMPAFGTSLSPSQVRGLVVFLREQERLASGTKPEMNRPIPADVQSSQHATYRLEIVSSGLTVPWASAFLPDGRILVTERHGALRIIATDGTLEPEPVSGTPPVVMDGPEGGLMDVVLHPDFKNNGWIYLSFADGRPQDGKRARAMTAVVRGRLKGKRWVDHEKVYEADDNHYTASGAHFGSRLVFSGGYLFVAIGERGAMGQAQDPSRPNGKVLRLHDDGRVPEDNPFVGVSGTDPRIWSLGHRNIQGLTLDSTSNTLYATEHGARGGDEFNQLKHGANYGWPVITHGINYNGAPIADSTATDGLEQPLVHWTPSIAPSGLSFYGGAKFPNWTGDFFAGGLKSQELRRLRVRGDRVVEEEILFQGFGRVRDVRSGPDGFLYVLINNPGVLLRLVPAQPTQPGHTGG